MKFMGLGARDLPHRIPQLPFSLLAVPQGDRVGQLLGIPNQLGAAIRIALNAVGVSQTWDVRCQKDPFLLN